MKRSPQSYSDPDPLANLFDGIEEEPAYVIKSVAGLPARLFGGNAQDVEVTGLDYTLHLDISKLPESAPPTLSDGKWTVVWDEVDGIYKRVEFTALPGGVGPPGPQGEPGVGGDWNTLVNKPATFPPSAHSHIIGDVAGLGSALVAKAPLVSPALTGTPTAPTATLGTSTVQLATTAFVAAAVSSVTGGTIGEAPNDGGLYGRKNLGWTVIPGGGGVPEAPTGGGIYGRKGSTASWELLDIIVNWGDIADIPSTFAPSAHSHPISEVTSLQAALDLKAPLNNAVFSGGPTSPTPPAGNNTSRIATTAFVNTAIVGKANTVHTHVVADVTDLQPALDAKVAKAGDTITGALSITDATASTSPTTGAFKVTGGLGVGGRLNVGGGGTFAETVAATLSTNTNVTATWPLYSEGLDRGWLCLITAASGTAAYFTQGATANAVGSILLTTTTTSFNTSSDVRLKEDLQSFDAGYIIDNTEVYDFKWKSVGERAYGVVAQQAVEVYPQVVTHDEEKDWWGVDYSKYVPVILQELKTLRARFAELEGALAPKKGRRR